MPVDKNAEGQQEQEQDVGLDEEEEEEESGASETLDTEGSASGASTSSKKKKKKKKKKKSKGAADGPASGPASTAGSEASSSTGSKVDKSECDKRFNAAMDDIRGDSEMWIKLSNCNIFDAKTKKIADALKANSSVTSVDLSCNRISDEGVQAMAAVLGANGAPELIELDLRDNPLSAPGLAALEGLGKARKHLVIKLGSVKQELEMEKMPPPGKGKDLREVTKGPMFRKYFQTGDEEDEPSTSGAADGQLSDGGLPPDELWKQVKAHMATGTPAIPQLSTLLQLLIGHLNHELGTLQTPHTDAAVDGSRPHIKGCIMNLDELANILALVPRQVTLQYSKEAQLSVGSHRVWATEIVSMLLAPNHTAMDNIVASSKLVARVLQLSLQHPMCSALHTRALRILRSCCVSKVQQLYAPLFTPGLGAGLTVDGGSELCGPLQQQLADRAAPALGVPSGQRQPGLGFVLEACKVLQACCDEANRESVLNLNVRRLLLTDSKWLEFVAEDGVLSQLCKEQEGDLGGPRAARPQMDEGSELAELAGGGLISSHEILALLQGMGAMGSSLS